MMEPYGSTYSLGYNLEDLYVPYDDCEGKVTEIVVCLFVCSQINKYGKMNCLWKDMGRNLNYVYKQDIQRVFILKLFSYFFFLNAFVVVDDIFFRLNASQLAKVPDLQSLNPVA